MTRLPGGGNSAAAGASRGVFAATPATLAFEAAAGATDAFAGAAWTGWVLAAVVTGPARGHNHHAAISAARPTTAMLATTAIAVVCDGRLAGDCATVFGTADAGGGFVAAAAAFGSVASGSAA